jgi:hypothetical protein
MVQHRYVDGRQRFSTPSEGENLRITNRTRLLAGFAAAALILAACGDDDDSASNTTAPAATAAPAAPTAAPATEAPATTAATEATTAATTAAPAESATAEASSSQESSSAAPQEGLPSISGDQDAKVMVLTDVTQGQIAYSAPEAMAATQAAFAGMPNVEVSVCDAKGDQNEYLNCQRKAVDEGDVAVIVGWSAGAQAGEDILYQAGIPVLGGGSATAPLSYSFTSGTGAYAGLGAGSATAGCTDMGILYLEGTDFLADMVKQGAESQGAKEVSRAAVPSNAPDLAPAIAKLLGDGANCIILSVSPPMVVQAMTAISQSGQTPLAAAVGAILPKQLLDVLGPLSEGMISIESALSSDDADAPVLGELKSAMEPFDSSAPVTVQSNLAFVSAFTLADAISKVDGEVTSAAIVEQLDQIRDLYVGGIVPPVNVVPLNSEVVPRFMNPWSLVYTIHDAKPVRFSDDFIDLRPAIEGTN